MCGRGIKHRSSAGFVLQRLASEAADNVTVTWQVCTSESKAGASGTGQGRAGFLKRLGLQHASVAIACTMGGRVAERSVKAARRPRRLPRRRWGLAPRPARVDWEGDGAIRVRSSNRTTWQAFYTSSDLLRDHGAHASSGQSRYQDPDEIASDQILPQIAARRSMQLAGCKKRRRCAFWARGCGGPEL